MNMTSEPVRAALRELGSLEARVITTMWEMEAGTVQDVVDRLNADNGKDLAYNTVMTVLARLAAKGLLRRERQGRGYRYHPAVDRQGLVEQQVADRFLEIIGTYGRSAWPIISREARKIDLTDST